MHEAMYAPGLGYYVSGWQKFGEDGDFVTAPEMGDLFGQCLADQCIEVLQMIDSGEVLEFGAGSGALAVTMLKHMEKRDVLPERYLILELSPSLRNQQEQLLAEKVPNSVDRVAWLEALPESSFRGVMIANEVLDAIPVRCFVLDEKGAVLERGAALDTENTVGFTWATQAADDTLKRLVVERVNHETVNSPYQSEVNLQAEAWVKSLAACLEKGAVLLIDYGFPRHEFYHPDRDQGTLMCHTEHRSHGNPFVRTGLQDITAHVDFTAMADSALAAGLQLAGFTNQASFLIALGILDKIDVEASASQQLVLAQQVKKLTMPHEMGELFKVLGLTRGVDQPLQGFTQYDQTQRLWTTCKSSS